MKRNPAVEFTRVLACFLVIMCHVHFHHTIFGNVSFVKNFYYSFLSDGVGFFWMITGFFLFRNQFSDYRNLWKHTLKRILVPVIFLYIFCFYFADWIIKGVPLLTNMSHTPQEYVSYIGKLLSLTNPSTYSDHVWYLFIYLLVILCFPVLKGFVNYLDQDVKRERNFIIITFIMIVMNDIFANEFLEFGFHTINGLFPAAIEIIWGHIIYRHRDTLKKKYIALITLSVWLVLNVIRAFIQIAIYNADSEFNVRIWFFSIGYLCSAIVVSWGISLIKEDGVSRFHRGVNWLASYTFTIYLIHPLIMEFLQERDVYANLQIWLVNHMPKLPASALYLVLGSVLVFSLCLISAILLRIIYRLLQLPVKALHSGK